MKQFLKTKRLDNVYYDVRGPVVQEANRMQEQGADVLKLNIGNPAPFGFHTPDSVIENVSRNLRNAEAYCDSKGLLLAREAIARYSRSKGIADVGPDDVFTGNGVSELITMTMQALLNHGDEVLLPTPDYPLWTASVTMVGGTPVHYVCDEQSDWMPDAEDIKRKVTSRTKAIVLINPNNPTGACYPREVLERIAEVARQNDLILFSDEIYDRLVYDGVEHVSTAAVAPDLFTVTLNGLSKSHRICGFRCGWMVLSGDKKRAASYIEGLNMLSSMRLCSNVPSLYAVEAALGEENKPDPDIMPGGRLFEQRRLIHGMLNSIPGVSAVMPKAAFYIFPKLDVKRFGITDDEKFAYDFLKQEKILIVQGSGFNWKSPDHFRIVYLPCVQDLKMAAEKLERFLSGYRQNEFLKAGNE